MVLTIKASHPFLLKNGRLKQLHSIKTPANPIPRGKESVFSYQKRNSWFFVIGQYTEWSGSKNDFVYICDNDWGNPHEKNRT
jgi:hypothetical protein